MTNLRQLPLVLAFLGLFTHCDGTNQDNYADTYLNSEYQSKEDRIKEIRALYQKSESLLSRASGCSTGQKNHNGTNRHVKMNYCDKAKICRLRDELSVMQGIFQDWEYGESVKVYLQNNNVYFVFMFGGSTRAACEYEQRVYFDKSGNIIRFLERAIDDDEIMSADREITDPHRIEEIRNYIFDNINIIKEIVN